MILREHWQAGDVIVHVHDSSYLPLVYYAPEADSYLLNNDPAGWLPPSVWKWAGRRVSASDEVVIGKKRLWLVIVPTKLVKQQSELLARARARHVREDKWTWDSVELELYSLRDDK